MASKEIIKPARTKEKVVLGYFLFSKTCMLYNFEKKKETTVKCQSTGELTFTNTSNLSDQSPSKRVEDLLSQLSIFTIEAIVFVHDGRFPIEWLKQARDVARKHSTRNYFISESMALKINALRLMKTAVKKNQTLALTFIYGSICLIYFLKRDASTYRLIDEVKYSVTKLEKVKNVLLSRRSTDAAVTISDKLSNKIRNTFVYKKATLNVELFEFKNFEKACVDGAITKAKKLVDKSGNFIDLTGYCGKVKIQIDNQLGASLCSPYEKLPKIIKKIINVKGAKKIKIIQNRSTLSRHEFIIYSNSNIPAWWEKIEITIKLFLTGLSDVATVPTEPQQQKKEDTKNNSLQNQIVNPLSALILSMRASKTFDRYERLKIQLKNLKCNFVIILNEDDCSASIEVFLEGNSYHVYNPSGNICTPTYISFFKEKVKIGETALSDYRKRPQYVVFDMIRILGRSTDQVCPQSTWRFSISKNPRNPKTVVYEVETWQGRRAITPEFALGLYFKALKNLAESISRKPQTRVTIFIPAYYKTSHNNSLKEACTFAGLSLVQTMPCLRKK